MHTTRHILGISESVSLVGEEGSYKGCKIAKGQTRDGVGGSNDKIKEFRSYLIGNRELMKG